MKHDLETPDTIRLRRARATRTGRARGRIIAGDRLSLLRRITLPEVSAVLIRRSVTALLGQLDVALPEAGFCRMVPLGDGFNPAQLVGTSFPPHVARRMEHEFQRLHRAVRSIHGGAGHAQFYVTDTDECRKFHVDYYRLRLLVTYVGPGTELAPERGLDRSLLGGLEDDIAAANRSILAPDVEPVRSPAGAVVVLKGARWGDGLPAVHRSPPRVGSARGRLVLKLTVE